MKVPATIPAFDAGSGYESRWTDSEEILVIWHEPKSNHIVVDTPGYDGLVASLDASEARAAAAALIAFADLSEVAGK